MIRKFLRKFRSTDTVESQSPAPSVPTPTGGTGPFWESLPMMDDESLETYAPYETSYGVIIDQQGIYAFGDGVETDKSNERNK